MGFWILMVLAIVGAFAIPPIFGGSTASMFAAHLCILIVTLAIFFGTLNLNKKAGPK